jgi:putative PEP-CTERM system TPR-repeat lipoprotein
MRYRLLWSLLIGGFALLWPAMASADYLSDGRQSLLKGDMRTAVIQLRNAVKADPQSAEAHFLLARVQLELGDVAAAQKQAQNALARGYDKQQVLPLMISTYLVQGRFAEALQDFQVENKDAATDSVILIARGYAYSGLQRLDEAEKAFNDAETLAPNSLQPAIASARLALTRGDLENAQTKLARASRIAPDAIDVQLIKTQVLRLQNDAAGALALLDQIIAKQPGSLKARMDRASLYLALGRDKEAKADNDAVLVLKPNDVQGIFMRALLAARARDFNTADVQLDQLSRVLGRLPRAYFLQAVVKQNLGQLEQAEDAALRYAAREPEDMDGIKLLARIQLMKRKPVPVINALTRAAAAGRADFELYDLLGRAFSLNGQSSEAVDAFRSAQLLAPDNLGVNMRLASARLRIGETDAAIFDLERSLRLAPGDTAVSEQLFAASMATGDLSRAEEVLGRIKASLGDTPTVGNLEAVLLMARVDLGAARTKLEDVIRRAPDFTLAKFNLARLALMEGKKEESDRLLVAILSKNPSSDPALSMYVGGLVGGGKITPAIEVLERARADAPANNRLTSALADLYVRAGGAGEALVLIGVNIKASLLPTDLLGARARAQLALGQVKDARDTYMELLDRDRSDIAVRRTVAGLMVGIGDVESARNTLQAGLKIDPQAFPLMQDLVAVDFSAGGVDPALLTAEKFERLNSDFPLARVLRGDVYMAAKRWDEAIAVYTRALREVRNPPTLMMIRLGTALYSSGNAEKADQVLRAWVKAHPDDIAALQFLSELDMNEKRYADAEQDFLKLLEKRPRDPAFLNNLAWLYQQRGDKQARATAQQAYVLRPVADIADTLGWILVGEGEYPTALVLLRQANGEANNDPRIGYHYAVALQKTGHTREAIKVLKPIVDGEVIFDERAEATKFLGDLSKGS